MSRLIDADELLDKAWDAENGFGWEKVVSLYDVMTVPTIDPVKHGRWITKSTNGEFFDCCSSCGYVEWDEPKNYCPHCGARMERSEDDGTDRP